MKLSKDTEEVATFYAHMLDHDYTTKDIFNKNFFKDWRKFMTSEEKETITDLKKCDFTHMHTYFKGKPIKSKSFCMCVISCFPFSQQNLKRKRIELKKKNSSWKWKMKLLWKNSDGVSLTDINNVLETSRLNLQVKIHITWIPFF